MHVEMRLIAGIRPFESNPRLPDFLRDKLARRGGQRPVGGQTPAMASART